jgi:predicted nucleic acid-binding protein
VALAYLDTSALGRVLLGEPDAPAILEALAEFEQRVASRLARVELCRLALRTNLLADAERLLGGVALVPVDETLLTAAETIEPDAVATLDAIHLATAVQIHEAVGLNAVLTYDRRLTDGARHHGLTVLAPE